MAGVGRRLVAVCCLVAVLVVGGVATSGIVAADGTTGDGGSDAARVTATGTAMQAADNVTITRRSNSHIVVGVREALFPETANRSSAGVTITVGDKTTQVDGATSATADRFNFRVRVKTITPASGNFSSATVRVALPDGATVSERGVDLRQLSFGQSVATRVDGTVDLRLRRAVGVRVGDPVSVAVRQSGAAQRIDARIVQSDNAIWLRFSIAQLSNRIDLFGPPIAVSLFPDHQNLTDEQDVDLVRATRGTNATYQERGTVLVAHPLFRDRMRVTVVARTGQPDGRYVATKQVRDGNVTLPGELFLAETTAVTMTVDGHEVVRGVTLGQTRSVMATVHGTTVEFDDGVRIPSRIRILWIQTNQSILSRPVASQSASNLTIDGQVPPTSAIESILVIGQRYNLAVNLTDTGAEPAGPTGETENGTTKVPAGSQTDGGPIVRFATSFGIGLFVAMALSLIAEGRGRRFGTILYAGIGVFFCLVLVAIGWRFEFMLNGNSLLSDGLMIGGYFVPLIAVGAYGVREWFEDDSSSPSGRSGQKSLQPQGSARKPGDRSGRNSRGAGGGVGTRTYEIPVEFVDTKAGNLVQDEVTFTKRGSGKPTVETVEQGKTSVELRQGEKNVTLEAEWRGQTETERIRKVRGSTTVRLEFEPYDVTVTVVDAETNDALSNATVELSDKGQSGQKQTDQRGRSSFEVSLHADSVEVTVEAPNYVSQRRSVSPDEETELTVPLEPLTGAIEATVLLDGDRPENVPVTVRPSDSQTVGRERTVRTDANGTVTVTDLRVGEYELAADLPQGADSFRTSPVTTRVEDGRTTRERLRIEYGFSLSRQHRQRLDAIRDDIDSIETVARRDTVIPGFYASVVREYLALVESLESSGVRLFTHQQNPTAVADAMLDAAETAIRVVDEVMTSKRNVDLFTACSDLPDQQVAWNGSFALGELFDLTDTSTPKSDHLNRFDTRKREVEKRIDAERGDLAEVSPAQEMVTELATAFREERPSDALGSAALVVLTTALLDAVERLFERELLRERMTQTVF